MFLNQTRAGRITFTAQVYACVCVRACVCVCVCVCAYTPEAIKISGMILLYMIDRIIAAAFQFRFMTLAIDVINRRGPSNKMRHQLSQRRLR